MRRGVNSSSMLSFQENLEVMGQRLLCRARKQGDEGEGARRGRWRKGLELGNK